MDDNAWIRKILFDRELLYCGDPKILRMMQRRIKTRVRELWKEIERRQFDVLFSDHLSHNWYTQRSIESLKAEALRYEAYLTDQTLNEQVDYILRLIDGLPERQQRILIERLSTQATLDTSLDPLPSTKRVQLRLTLFEHQRLTAIALATGFTVSQILRRCLLETTELTDIQWELRRNTPNEKLDKKIWVRLPIHLMARVTKLGRANRVPTSTFIRAALRHYIEKQNELYEKQRKLNR